MIIIALFTLFRCENSSTTDSAIEEEHMFKFLRLYGTAPKPVCGRCALTQSLLNKKQAPKISNQAIKPVEQKYYLKKSTQQVVKGPLSRGHHGKKYIKDKKKDQISKNKAFKKKYGFYKGFAGDFELEDDEYNLFEALESMQKELLALAVKEIRIFIHESKMIIMKTISNFIHAYFNRSSKGVEPINARSDFTLKKISLEVDEFFADKQRYLKSLNNDVRDVDNLIKNEGVEGFLTKSNEHFLKNLANLIDKSRLDLNREVLVDEIKVLLNDELSGVLSRISSSNDAIKQTKNDAIAKDELYKKSKETDPSVVSDHVLSPEFYDDN